MNLYLDDNLAEKHLANFLAKDGHSVIQPVDVSMNGKSDPKHFVYSIQNHRLILTRDREDFEELHQLVTASGGSHPGILVVRSEKDSTKKMKPRHIVVAISNLAKSGFECANNYVVLNHWR